MRDERDAGPRGGGFGDLEKKRKERELRSCHGLTATGVPRSSPQNTLVT